MKKGLNWARLWRSAIPAAVGLYVGLSGLGHGPLGSALWAIATTIVGILIFHARRFGTPVARILPGCGTLPVGLGTIFVSLLVLAAMLRLSWLGWICLLGYIVFRLALPPSRSGDR
jgi:hypothetical protein